MNAVREEGCKSPGLRIFRLVDSQNHLKKALGFFIKGGKEGWGFVLGGPPRAALERRELLKVTLFYLALEVGFRKSIFYLRWFFQLN